MYKLCVYIPEQSAEIVKQAMFDAGAGQVGFYDSCSWEVKGEGQFRPLKGSQPSIGQLNQIERVAEFKVELIVEDDHIVRVIEALKHAHPYEEPAYQYWQINPPLY